jgi:hypothetical protein
MHRGLFGVVAAGHRAIFHRAHIMFAVATVHRRVICFLWMVVITMNWTLIATAACAGDRHYGSARNRCVYEHERKEAEERARTLPGGKPRFV